MTDESEAFPLQLLIDETDSETYASRNLWPTSGPNKPSNGEKFILAMAYGFKAGTRTPLGRPDPSFQVRSEYLKDDEKTLIYAVAVAAEGNLDMVLNGRAAAVVAEEYAHGGITCLARKLRDNPNGTLWDDLAAEILGQDMTELSSETSSPGERHDKSGK